MYCLESTIAYKVKSQCYWKVGTIADLLKKSIREIKRIVEKNFSEIKFFDEDIILTAKQCFIVAKETIEDLSLLNFFYKKIPLKDRLQYSPKKWALSKKMLKIAEQKEMHSTEIELLKIILGLETGYLSDICKKSSVRLNIVKKYVKNLIDKKMVIRVDRYTYSINWNY